MSKMIKIEWCSCCQHIKWINDSDCGTYKCYELMKNNKPSTITDRTKILKNCPLDDNPWEDLKDKLDKIKSWCEAYPVKIFPEPGFKKAAKILKENGMRIDNISASNMRHVLKGIKNIIEEK